MVVHAFSTRICGGSIALDGQAITSLPPHARVKSGFGYVPQGREIFALLSVEESRRSSRISAMPSAISRDTSGMAILLVEQPLTLFR